MKQKEIWGKYILAQEKILEHRSLPIAINNSDAPQIANNKIKLTVDQEIFKKIFKAEVEKLFKIENFDFSTNHILQDLEITENISQDDLIKLKEEAQNYYIEFNEHPVIEGEITANNSTIQDIEKILGKIPSDYSFKKDGLILLTTIEKESCEEITGLSFNSNAGAVYQIKPSICYLLSTFYKNINVWQDERRIIYVEGELHQSVFSLFNKFFDLEKKGYELYFETDNPVGVVEIKESLEEGGVELPRFSDNKFHIFYKSSFFEENNTDLRIEVNRLKKFFCKIFPNCSFTFKFNTQYRYNIRKLDEGTDKLNRDESKFWDLLFNNIHGDVYQISNSKHTISFDFESNKDLQEKKNFLKSLSYLEIYDRGELHKYKYNLRIESGLHNLQRVLNSELPNLSLKLISNGAKLLFRRFYKAGNKDFIRDILQDKLSSVIDPKKYEFTIYNTFKEKYLCEENFDLKIELEEEKLSKLRREDFYFGNKKTKYFLGRLQKVDYPVLEFFIEDDRINEVQKNIAFSEIKAIFPDLKGEKDKIIRLRDTINLLESDEKLPNENMKTFLFDSSQAKKIDDIDYLLNQTSQEWKTFENNIFSEQLNISQKQAIYKSLYAEELALIQGPPGTGKSTAIAEIIWHHILRNQNEKVLLTSETNLAVDNAIDRLKNDEHNIVKPIRFGSDDKLESEGRFYSLTTFDEWKNGIEVMDSNAVSHWLNNIVRRIKETEDDDLNLNLQRWKEFLKNPDTPTKELFVEKYIEHANIIGATGSSIGKFNSEQKYTSFFHSYLSVFARKQYTPQINWQVCNKTKIVFDTVIMDEASKATPPELALPVIYGKKAIIVGDHRQLPPMVDDGEIKETLISIGEKNLAQTLSRKEFEKSQFQILFENIDESIKGSFDTQYRMHPAINNVIAQFYSDDGGLKCGLPIEEEFHTSFTDPMSRFHGLEFNNILNPETHVMWINVNTPEVKEGTSRANFGEIKAIHSILSVIKKSNGYQELKNWLEPQTKEEKQIGLISFYGKQVGYLNRMIRNYHTDIPIRLSTVDKFQGMERNIIIVSMVRSNKIATSKEQMPDSELYGELGFPSQDSLGFAEFPNRLNVALSRARRLLIIVGNKDHFCKKEIYNNVYNEIINSEHGKIIQANDLIKDE